jgi:hypothetical protein
LEIAKVSAIILLRGEFKDKPLHLSMLETVITKKNQTLANLKAKDILHRIYSWFATYNPGSSAQGSTGESHSICCLVGDFNPFSETRKRNRMISNNISAS